jgi:protein ImuB
MPRVVSLFLPTWPTDRLRRKLANFAPQPETPIAMVGRDGRRRVVLAADRAARAAGVSAGMAASQAQAMIPGLVIHEADGAGDAEALERLARWALKRYSPIVAVDLPDGIVIDTTGADHLHGGEEKMLAGLVERFAASGTSARAAVADSWGAAHAVARFGRTPVTIIPPGETGRYLAHCPIAALRLPKDLVDQLRTLGFDTIGELAAQPRAPLALRFGPELHRRLDQTLCRQAEPIDPVRDPELIAVRRVFAEPIGAAETIGRFISVLALELCARLEEKGLGARRLDLVCHRVDGALQAVRAGTALPIRDPRRVARLLGDRIEAIDPGFGIEIMVLTAVMTEPLGARQLGSALAEETEADVSDLVDTIGNRIGADRLYRIAPVASDVPERSIRRIAPMATDEPGSWPGQWPRPTRLLANPEPVDTVALLPDHPPVSFTWRGIRRRVKRADGPERIFGEWWKRDAELEAVRDYFQVEDEAGSRYWLFRAGDGEDAATGSQRWFLHGIFG